MTVFGTPVDVRSFETDTETTSKPFAMKDSRKTARLLDTDEKLIDSGSVEAKI